jgi:hypothetical protein
MPGKPGYGQNHLCDTVFNLFFVVIQRWIDHAGCDDQRGQCHGQDNNQHISDLITIVPFDKPYNKTYSGINQRERGYNGKQPYGGSQHEVTRSIRCPGSCKKYITACIKLINIIIVSKANEPVFIYIKSVYNAFRVKEHGAVGVNYLPRG